MINRSRPARAKLRSGWQAPDERCERTVTFAAHEAEAGVAVAGNVYDMAGPTGMLGWRDMEAGAPVIARLGTARLNAARVAMLGTLRRDGSPRISPIEPYLVNGRLLVGAMAWSGKTADLRRDPRYVLHSIVTAPDSGEGELKLQGLAAEASPVVRTAVAGAWWSNRPPERADVFVLGIEQALFIEWDIEHGVMTIHRWSAPEGYSRSARTYP